MNPKIKTNKGWTEVIIDDDCGYEKFYKIADVIKNSFKLKFTEKLNDFDTLYWDFIYKGSILVLFYNIYEGTTIFPRNFKDSTTLDNENSKEFGTSLFFKLIELDWTQFEDGKTIGTKGSEDGKILYDSENSNGARVTLEEECGNIPFAITIGIYGLMFHTHFESDLSKSQEYILDTKHRVNKVFDLYEIQEDKRDEYWERKHDNLINKIAGVIEMENKENQQLTMAIPKKGFIEKLKVWFS